MNRRDESGSAVLELVLGLCLLVLPAAMLAGALPTWVERESAARLAAREAARTYVLAATPGDAERAATAALHEVVRNHRFDPGQFRLRLDGALSRGAQVTAEVTTRAPLLWVPGMGRFGGFTLTARHTERVDDYRSW